MDKLEKLNKLLALVQEDTVRPSDIRQFLEAFATVSNTLKAEFAQISRQNLDDLVAKIDRTLSDIEGTATAKKNEIEALSTARSSEIEGLLGDAPVFVNPGEFVQLCTRHIGTVGTSGTIVHRVTPVYGWE